MGGLSRGVRGPPLPRQHTEVLSEDLFDKNVGVRILPSGRYSGYDLVLCPLFLLLWVFPPGLTGVGGVSQTGGRRGAGSPSHTRLVLDCREGQTL